jgi:phage terminase small subunit
LVKQRGRKSKAAQEVEGLGPTLATVDFGKPAAPRHLQTAGATFFNQMVRETDVAGADKLAVLTRACECLDRIAAAQASIADHGEVTVNQHGQPKLNPACMLEKQARDGFFAAMRMLDIEDAPEPDRYGYRR